MGYSTNFTGSIQLSRKLTLAEAKRLLEIAELDREEAKKITGIDAHLQWVPSVSLDKIVWDGGEKFYDYIPLLGWLCRYLDNLGIHADGAIDWSGESSDDFGRITVENNLVSSRENKSNPYKSAKPLTLRDLEKTALEQLTQSGTE